MFEKTLEKHFKNIFKIKEVTYAQPSEVKEQEVLWINVESARNTIKDGREMSIVRGQCTVFGRAQNIPFGFFSKAIHKADAQDTKNLYFYDFEANTKYYRDLVQRDFSFIFFYNSQYDPEQGEITSIDFTTKEL